MGKVTAVGHRHPEVYFDRLFAGRTISGRGEYVQSQNGLAVVHEADHAHRDTCQVQHKVVFRRHNGQSSLFEKDERLLAVALPADDYDPQHLSVPRSYLCSTESDRPLDMGHGFGPVSKSHRP